jgi:hypothetical protein
VSVAEIALYPADLFSRIAADLPSKMVVIKMVEATSWAVVLRGIETGSEFGLASAEAPQALLHFPNLEICVTTALEVSGSDKLYFERLRQSIAEE